MALAEMAGDTALESQSLDETSDDLQGDPQEGLLGAVECEGRADAAPGEDVPKLASELLRSPALRRLLGDVAHALGELNDVQELKDVGVMDVGVLDVGKPAARSLSLDVRGAALAAFDASLRDAISVGVAGCSQRSAPQDEPGEVTTAVSIPEALMSEALMSEALMSEALMSEALKLDVDLDAPELEEELLRDVSSASEAAATESLSPAVRSVALAAFARESLAREPIRTRPLRPLLGPRSWVAAAAMLLLFLGAALFLSGGGQQAEAGLQLSSLARVNRAGPMCMSQVQPRYFAEMGSRFAPVEDELLAFGFGPDSRLIVGSGDAVRVTDAVDVRASVGSDVAMSGAVLGRSAFMRLESGEVLLVTRSAPVPLLVNGAGLFVLLDGAAHVAVTGFHLPSAQDALAGSGSGALGGVAVALPRGARARFYARDGSQIDLVGPATGLLSAAGAGSFGEETRSLFDELKFFGGPLPRLLREAPISARACGVRSGHVRQGRQDLQILVPKIRTQAQSGQAQSGQAQSGQAQPGQGHSREAVNVVLTWRPRPWLAGAHLLRVHLRAPAGTRLSVPSVGPDGRASVARVSAARVSAARVDDLGTMASEPGIAFLEIPLAQGWYERLDGRPLLLVLHVPAAVGPEARRLAGTGVAAWFDGLTAVLAASPPEADASAARMLDPTGQQDD